MIPFNLEAVKNGHPVRKRRDDKRLIYIAHVPQAAIDQRLVMLDHNGEIVTFCEDGVFDTRQKNSGMDLFMVEAETSLEASAREFTDAECEAFINQAFPEGILFSVQCQADVRDTLNDLARFSLTQIEAARRTK